MATDANPACLRCVKTDLIRSASYPEIAFFECPVCHRRYALEPGKELTFRWLHPISLALYSILFGVDRSPLELLRRQGHVDPEPMEPPLSPLELEQRRGTIDEIELELDHPTQQVRDILDNPQTEEECRNYLREYVAVARQGLSRDHS